MNKVAIKVTSKEHGVKVVEYFKSKGVDIFGKVGTFVNAYYFPQNNNRLDQSLTFPQGYTEITQPEEKTFPREMLVWDNDGREFEAEVKFVFGIFPNRDSPFKVITNSSHYRYAKELPEVKLTRKMTVAQICEELGEDIEIVK